MLLYYNFPMFTLKEYTNYKLKLTILKHFAGVLGYGGLMGPHFRKGGAKTVAQKEGGKS